MILSALKRKRIKNISKKKEVRKLKTLRISYWMVKLKFVKY